MKILKSDNVLVIQGKDRLKSGKVLHAWPCTGKILVEGVNIVTKHCRPKQEGKKGQCIKAPRPIDASNVKIICPHCKQAVKIGYSGAGRVKNRICKKCGKII